MVSLSIHLAVKQGMDTNRRRARWRRNGRRRDFTDEDVRTMRNDGEDEEEEATKEQR